MAHPLPFASFPYPPWYHFPHWPFLRPQPMFAPPPYPPRGSTLPTTFVSQYLSKTDPLVLLILVLATHDVSSKWEEMVEASRLLPDNRLWMKDRDELALNLVSHTDIAEELRSLLDLKGRVNPWDWLHPPGQPDVRDPSPSSPREGSAILAERACLKRRRNSDPGSDRSGLWMRNLVEAQRAGNIYFFDRYLSMTRDVENWRENVSPISPTGPPTPPSSADTSASRRRCRRRSPLANYESGMGVIQSIEEDYTMGSQNRRASANGQSSNHERVEVSPGDLEDERTRCLRSCTPLEELLDRATRVRFEPVHSAPESVCSMETVTVRPRGQSDSYK